MASKKKLPRSRRCRESEYLGLYCNCEYDDVCRRTCCRSADIPDLAAAARSSSESSDKHLYQTDLDGVEVEIDLDDDTRHQRQLPPHDGHKSKPGPHRGPEFDRLDVLVGLSSIAFFYFDVVTDCLLARDYYYQDDMLSFGLTTTFIVGPGIITMILNLRWYYLDYQSQYILLKHHGPERVKQTSHLLWIARFVLTLCFMGPVMR